MLNAKADHASQIYFNSILYFIFNASFLWSKQRNYAEKYRNREGITVHEVGLVFNKTERNLVQADCVTARP